jgi:hypothetical protein
VSYALEFLCLTVAKIMVLDRLVKFAIGALEHARRSAEVSSWRKRVVILRRLLMACVVMGNVAGLCGNIAAAVFAVQSAHFFTATAAAVVANSTALLDCSGVSGCTAIPGFRDFELAFEKASSARQVASVQQLCEVAVLFMIVLAFSSVSYFSLRTFKSAMSNPLENRVEEAGTRLWRRIFSTTVFVFVSFLLRSAFSVMNAVSNMLQNNGAPTCPDAIQCSAACFNMWQLIQEWLQFTPEFQQTVVVLSSPLALLVALWGMTNSEMLRLMQAVELVTTTNLIARFRAKTRVAKHSPHA